MNVDLHPHGTFWQFKLAHLLTLLTMLGGIVIFITRFENRVSQIESTQKAMLETDARIGATIDRMDLTGTYASQRGIQKDAENVISNTRRIESLEVYVRDIGPKVERLNANMDWLIKSLQDGGTIKHDAKENH